MIKYDLFRTAFDNKLVRVNLDKGMLDSVEILCSSGWRKHGVLTAADFYCGGILAELIARNVVFKASLCSQ